MFLCFPFRNRKVYVFQFLMLSIVFLCLGSLLGSLFRNREVFSSQFLMLFTVFLCLVSLVRNREDCPFFNFLFCIFLCLGFLFRNEDLFSIAYVSFSAALKYTFSCRFSFFLLLFSV